MPTPYDDLLEQDDLMDLFCLRLNRPQYFANIAAQSDDWVTTQAIKADHDIREALHCIDPMAPYARRFLQLLQAEAKKRNLTL